MDMDMSYNNRPSRQKLLSYLSALQSLSQLQTVILPENTPIPGQPMSSDLSCSRWGYPTTIFIGSFYIPEFQVGLMKTF